MNSTTMLRPDGMWLPVDRHPLVLDGILSRDQLYRAAHEDRVRRIWVSSRRLLVHRDAATDLAQSGRPGNAE